MYGMGILDPEGIEMAKCLLPKHHNHPLVYQKSQL